VLPKLKAREDRRGERITGQALYVQPNGQPRSCNRCCNGKAISITYSECVFVAAVIRHAIRLRHIVTCDMSGCTIYFRHDLVNGTIFGKSLLVKKLVF